MPIGDWTIFKMLVEFMRNGSHIGIVKEDAVAVAEEGTL